MSNDPSQPKQFLEIETKYDASSIDRMQFKLLAETLSPKSFLYVESRDVYYVKSENEFLRYRMPQSGDTTGRSELTFKKKKQGASNNIVRTEVNLRVDKNDAETVDKFATGLGYVKNFSIFKHCDIYFFEDANIVFYSVVSENNKVDFFVEIECNEELNIAEEQGWEIIQKYEKHLVPLGITAQKRKRLSLFEMYVKKDAPKES